jgi:solute carrier family 25, member 39/40
LINCLFLDLTEQNLKMTTAEGAVAVPPASTRHDVLVKLVSATCGALITSFVTTPLEVVKTRLQTSELGGGVGAKSVAKAVVEYCKDCAQKSSQIVNNLLSSSSTTTTTTSHSSTMSSTTTTSSPLAVPHRSAENCAVCVDLATTTRNGMRTAPSSATALSTLVSVARVEGIPALWSGLSISLAMTLPTTALYFTCYDEIKYAIESTSPSLAPFSPLMAGSSARALVSTALSPLELLRTKAMHRRSNLSIINGLRAEITEGGVRSLYRGLGPSLFRDVPFSGLYWLNYEWLRSLTLKRFFPNNAKPTSSELWMTSFISGLGSGTFAALVTTPFDVVKTRKQVKYNLASSSTANHLPSSSPSSSSSSLGTFTMLRAIFKEEGLAGVFRGWNMRVARVGPASAIMVSSYELGKRLLSSSSLSSTSQ